MIIGITGGVGSGKSYVLSILKEHFGCMVLEADQIAYQLQQPGQSCYNSMVDIFGKKILAKNGMVDRNALGNIVFSNPDLLEKLNQIVHPAVKQTILEQIEWSQKQHPEKDIVIEAALLLEDHYDQICDTIWYIWSEDSLRRKRLKESRGYSEEKIASIMKNQLSEEEFLNRCQCRIVNNGSKEDLLLQIIPLMKK